MFARFVVYGMAGWIVEVVWTGMGSMLRKDPRLTARTYLWMFPIYGGGALMLELLLSAMAPYGWMAQGLGALAGIYAVEYSAGWLLRRLTGRVPWDYSGQPWAVHELIRLDYAPAWFVLALLFERVRPALAAVAAAASSMIK